MITAEESLMNALKDLYKIFYKDGSGVTMGLGDYLNQFGCKMVSYLSQVLKRDGYVDVVKQGKHNVLFWNKNGPPNEEMVATIVEETRKMKLERRQQATVDTVSNDQKNAIINELIEKARVERGDLLRRAEELERTIKYLEKSKYERNSKDERDS